MLYLKLKGRAYRAALRPTALWVGFLSRELRLPSPKKTAFFDVGDREVSITQILPASFLQRTSLIPVLPI